VAAVDEDQAQRGGPQAGHVGGAAHDHDHALLQAGGGQGGAQARQRVQAAGGRVDQVGVVVLPAGLVFLGTAVVVDGDHHLARGTGRGGEVDGGLAAVGADLQDRAARRVPGGGIEQGEALGGRHEAGDGFGGTQQVRVHPGHDSR
jgi:hypothetical protein